MGAKQGQAIGIVAGHLGRIGTPIAGVEVPPEETTTVVHWPLLPVDGCTVGF